MENVLSWSKRLLHPRTLELQCHSSTREWLFVANESGFFDNFRGQRSPGSMGFYGFGKEADVYQFRDCTPVLNNQFDLRPQSWWARYQGRKTFVYNNSSLLKQWTLGSNSILW
jgi:hypothetical protein